MAGANGSAQRIHRNFALSAAAIATQRFVTFRYILWENLRFKLPEAVDKLLVFNFALGEGGFQVVNNLGRCLAQKGFISETLLF